MHDVYHAIAVDLVTVAFGELELSVTKASHR